MKRQILFKSFGYLFLILVLVLAAGFARGLADQQKTRPQLSAMKAKFPDSARQFPPCINCSRLSVHICSIPGYGCSSCNDFLDYLGVVSYFDPDFWIHNHGDLPSNPGMLTVQWYDLVAKGTLTRTVPIPPIPAGGDDYVTFPIAGIVILGSEGVTLTLDYSDSAGTRHKVRKATKCPDK